MNTIVVALTQTDTTEKGGKYERAEQKTIEGGKGFFRRGGWVMSAGSNPNLIASVGSVQQKSAMAAYNRSVLRSETKSPVPRELGGSQTAQETQDSTSISRAAIAALESTRVISEETVIRDDKAAASALEYTKDQIKQQTDRAVMAHGNQMSHQVLEMYGQ